MDGRQPVSISLTKSRSAIMAAKNALLTPCSAITYPIMGQVAEGTNSRFASLLRLLNI
ncbi:hypothetical protein [Bacillus atrophaeus]|uniref:hypothetical protein n=1 Tax=Bacillus atrophaeus TaxID=1452 RepID=UPI00227E71E9|nr:hypothetical protein [Bacillus atrophaeus]MCY8516131.1 hypothetical protein [Bacillus atrophaeus]